jgi:hypothetical protein
MPKTYAFTVTLQEAQASTFGDGGVSIVFGGYSSTYAKETKECTLAEVLEFRKEVSAREPRLHVAFIGMANRRDRKPPGFDKATGDYTVGGRVTEAATA